jgi:hypothetical protein
MDRPVADGGKRRGTAPLACSVSFLTDRRNFESHITGRFSRWTLQGLRMSIIPLLSKSSFDPEVIEVLASAFDTAWQRVQNSGSPLAAADVASSTRETLAKNIIAAATTGIRDENSLVERALSGMIVHRGRHLDGGDSESSPA